MPALILVNGKISFGHLFAGYLGLLLLGARRSRSARSARRWRARRCWPRSSRRSWSLVLVLSHLLSRVTERPLTDVFMALALYARHFPPFQMGVIHVRDVVYYLALTYVALFAAAGHGGAAVAITATAAPAAAGRRCGASACCRSSSASG